MLYFYLSILSLVNVCFFLLFINFSLWFMLVQNFISFSLVFLVSFYLKSVSFLFLSFGMFLLYYLLLEVLLEVLMFINHVFNLESLFFMVLIFKVSGFPFVYYNKIFSSLFLGLVFFSLLFLFYFLLFKVLLIMFLFNTPLQTVSFLAYLFLLFYYFLSYFEFSIKDFTCNSFIFSNMVFMMTGLFFNFYFTLFYTIFSSIFQYKIFNLFCVHKYGLCFKYSCFLLMLLNGNPVFVFNWFKFYTQSVLLDISFLLSVFYISVGSLFLGYSVYMFVYCNGYDFYCLSPASFIYFIFLFSILFSLIQLAFGGVVYCFIFFSSYQFMNLFPGTLSMDFFLMYGENISVSVFLVLFMFFMFFSSSGFLGVNSVNSFLHTSHIVSIFGMESPFNYFDSIMFLVPYSLMLVSTSNFIFLVEGINFLNMGDFMVLVFLMAYQWGWSFSLMLSSSFVFYLDFFYVLNVFNHNTNLKVSCMFCFIFFTLDFYCLNFHFLDYILYFYLTSFLSNMIFNGLFLPSSVSIFVQGVSLDVMHSFFMPSLSIKEDLVSDKVFSSFINVLGSGSDYLEFSCFEYCGDFHYSMFGCFYVLDFNSFSLLLKKSHEK